MSFELPNATLRTAVDIWRPISVNTKSEWTPITEALADDMIATSDLLLRAANKPLADNYRVEIQIEEPDLPFEAVIVNDPNKLKDIDALFNKVEPRLDTWIGLKPEEGMEDKKALAIIISDADSLRLSVWGTAKVITIRNTEFNVRHQQYWRLWNYNAAKKMQGYSEEDYPGNEWRPDYSEDFVIADGASEGENLISVLTELDESIEEATRENAEESAWDRVVSKVNNRGYYGIHLKVLKEVSEATGITPHQTAGVHTIQEAHQVLAAIRAFV